MNYPHFIADKPEGKDLYAGQSQNRIAANIIQFLTENDNSNRKVIGVEGEWGSGKSNVIEILRNELKDDYFFFIFDSWGHQEDLTRRSILEGLLSKLIEDKVLKGEKKYWDEELKNLLSKKIEKKQTNIPKISWGVILSVLGIVLIPITKFIADNYLKSFDEKKIPVDLYGYLVAMFILLLSFVPLMGWIIFSVYRAEKGKGWEVLEELFYIYKGKEITNILSETISENEPTVLQFTKFLSKLENGAIKKLVIVFDNMDRLPSTKVKEVWSSIHTFFASDYNNKKTWAIVPFDNAHICDIFKDEDGKQRADSYIHKTFSIVFHISPPLISDWKNFFNSQFLEAFGYTPPPEQNIDTIFDYHHIADPKIKPRDIICFINDLVALKKLWTEQIALKYLALFALKRADILEKDPFSAILTKSYLGNELTSLFKFDEDLQTNISALAFNVPISIAGEILIKPTIQKALSGSGTLTQVFDQKCFLPVLKSAFYNSPIDIVHTISCFDSLPLEIQVEPEIINFWEDLSGMILKVEKFEPTHVDAIKTLARRSKNHFTIESLIRHLFTEAISPDDQKRKYFAGAKYYQLIVDVDSLLKDIWEEKPITELLPYNDVEPDEYFDFINSCIGPYQNYKVTCDNKKLNEFLISKFDANEMSKYFNQLDIIKENTDLSEFKKHVNDLLPSLTPALPDYQKTITNVFGVGKALAIDGKLLFVLPENIALALLTAVPTDECAVDLLLSIISANILSPTPEHMANPVCKKLLGEVSHKASFIKLYKYYMNYTALIKYHLQNPSELIKAVISDLTIGSDSISGSDATFMLSKYNEIKTIIFDGKVDLLNMFISKVNGFYGDTDISSFDENALSYMIPIITDNHLIDCNLVNDVLSRANEFIDTLDKETWVSSFKESGTSLIIKLYKTLSDLAKYNLTSKLPPNASIAYTEVIKSISRNELPVPKDVDFWKKLYENQSGNLTTTFKDIRDELLRPNHGPVSIEELLFFENGLFHHGKVDDNHNIADETLRRILIPLATNDETYINLLKRNMPSINKIIEKAHDSIGDFKIALESKCPLVFEDTDLKEFSERLMEKFNSLERASENDNKEEVSEG